MWRNLFLVIVQSAIMRLVLYEFVLNGHEFLTFVSGGGGGGGGGGRC